ncbi:MAG: hypothetical protein LBM12_01425 [Candidatus Nomurabacteria bacterium]|jgi:hypothetical protein|nr:hypothetical protein [Candidatus Nomurabacteria bacterium]
MVVWGIIVLGVFPLGKIFQNSQKTEEGRQATSGRIGDSGQSTTDRVGEAERILQGRFYDENGLTNEQNRGVIILAAEVVQLVEERGFEVGQVIVPSGLLREFDLIMNREAASLALPANPTDSAQPANTTPVRLRCSTSRLATATAADAIYAYDLLLDGEIQAGEYLDLRTPRRLFYY